MASEPIRPDPGNDPRTYFAAERTLLAWIRTGLAMMGFGFVVARFGLFLHELAQMHEASVPRGRGYSLWVGTALVLFGVIVCACAAHRHGQMIVRLKAAQPLEFRTVSLGVVVALALGLLGLLMAGYLLFGLRN